MNNNPMSRKSNVVVQEIKNEVLVYDLNINKAFCLNQTSAMVYLLSDGNNSVAEISALMSKKLKISVSEDLVWLALDGLMKDNLLENSEEQTNHFAASSRREAVKRVGLASLVMFPIISSIVAPNAAMAQSALLPLNAACSSSSVCQSNNCVNVVGNGPSCCVAGVSTPAQAPNTGVSVSSTNPVECLLVHGRFCCSGLFGTINVGVGNVCRCI